MRYVDGFVLPVPKKHVKAYFQMAKKAGKIWREHGALEYRECIGNDLKVKMGLPFPPPCQAQTRRNRGVLLDRVQVTVSPRSREREGHEGSSHQRDVRGGVDAVRREAHGLWRIQDVGRRRVTARIISPTIKIMGRFQ